MRRRFGLVAGAWAIAAATAGTGGGAPATASPAAQLATVLPTDDAWSSAWFPVHDAGGAWLRDATYVVTPAGGNCCEKYVASTRTGMLLELGGGLPHYSTDRGLSWFAAHPAIPWVGAEGAISPTPDDDAVGVTWDPYTGDRLVAFRYAAATGEWTYHDNPLHGPFFDRPWLAVVEGPFRTPAGGTAPWISIVQAGAGAARDVELVSYDGLVYTEVDAGHALAGAVEVAPGPLPVRSDADTDVIQPHARSGISPLPGSGAVRLGGWTCPSLVIVLAEDRTWECVDIGQRPWIEGDLRADSRGRLHNLVYGESTVTYRLSADGGATWRETVATVPGPITGTHPDVRVDGASGRAYVALRAGGNLGQQDFVLRFDTAGDAPRLAEVYRVGLGDLVAASSFTGGAGGAPRMDFASIALLPDGRFAVAYLDSTTRKGDRHAPWLAVLQ